MGDFLREALPYSLNDLYYELPIEISDYSASLTDPDNDDLFEEIKTDFTMKVKESGYYDLYFDFMLEINTQSGEVWGWGFSSYQFFEFDTTGNQDVKYNLSLKRTQLDHRIHRRRT